MKLKNYILRDHQYEFQQDNTNPDGSSNMVWTKEFGRFNDCFISKGTAANRQWLTRLRSKNLVRNEGFQKSFIDERAYKAALLSKLNGGDAWKDNPDRYLWQEHCDFQNLLLEGSFKEKLPGKVKWGKASVDKIIEVLKSNYQPIVGIWIQDYWKTGKGHITCVVGWQEDENGKVTGLFFNDPAGNLLAKNSYKNAGPLDGKEVFYPIEVFPKIFRNERQMMWFEENQNDQS